MVKQPHAPHHEHVFYALLELVTDFPAAIKVAQQPTLHMQSFLLDRQSFLQTNADAMVRCNVFLLHLIKILCLFIYYFI